MTNNASNFWTIARAGTTKAAQDLQNVNVQFRIPEDGTAATQTCILDDLLSVGVDRIAISPVDPKNETIELKFRIKENQESRHYPCREPKLGSKGNQHARAR